MFPSLRLPTPGTIGVWPEARARLVEPDIGPIPGASDMLDRTTRAILAGVLDCAGVGFPLALEAQ